MTLQRRKGLTRGQPLQVDPTAVAAWQLRSRRRLPVRRARPRRKAGLELGEELNPSEWWAAVVELRGLVCAVPGCEETQCETDHLIDRKHGGPYIVANGWRLCGPWSRSIPGGHHLAKTQHRLLIRRAWLDADQLGWLAAAGHAWWDEAGEVHGKHRRLFAPAE